MPAETVEAPVGDKVEVLWGNKWWAATVVKRDGQRAFIHYDGWGKNFDEWVTPDRMRARQQ
jgi:hypothetical protein